MTEPSQSANRAPMAANFLIGMGANFFDTLGIGSFATSTAVLRLFRLVEDENIPGTLNVGHALPTILEAALFLSAVPVEMATLILMVIAGGIGAWFGTGVVVSWPRRTVQRAMSIALVVTAAFISMRILLNLSLDEGTLGLSGAALVIAVVGSLVIGSLTSLGIGNYAPTMAMTFMLGMNAKAVFPVMATSASVILPAAAIRFYRSGRFDKRTAIGFALGGIPGVLIAVYVVKSLPLTVVKWIVVAVLLYTSATLWKSSQQADRTA